MTSPAPQEKLLQATHFIQDKTNFKPDYALVLGSGLGLLAEQVQHSVVIPYASIPHFAQTTAPGHAGNLVLGELGGKRVVLMQGRFHTYEGYSQQEVAFPIAVMHQLGAQNLVVTCATGGLNYNFKAGDLMLIRDHINFTGSNPLIGPNDDHVGPRFPVMFDAYSPELRKTALEVAMREGISLHEGVYCGITGPAFFTRSELRMLMQWGADSVGMSVVPEVIVAVHRGMQAMGIALISDMAIPDYGHHATGEEVLQAVKEASPKFCHLVKSVLNAL